MLLPCPLTRQDDLWYNDSQMAHGIEFTIEGEKEGRAMFMNLIRPRENVIRHGSPFVVATDDPAAELERQYENLVLLPCIPR